MTLRRKTLMTVGIVFVSLVIILYFISQTILMRRFSQLDEQRTRQNVEQVLNTLSGDLLALKAITADWANWDDTYTFVEDVNQDYIEKNLVTGTFTELRLNFMLFIHTSGQVVYSQAFDLDNGKETALPQSLLNYLTPGSLLVSYADPASAISGIILLPENPVLIVSHPILTSEEQGPIRGTLIMGRYLDAGEIERLAEQTRLSLTIHRFDRSPLPDDFQAVLPSLSEKTPVFVRPLDRESIAGYALIRDLYHKPILLLRVAIPRDIYIQGQDTVAYFIFSLLVVGAVSAVVVIVFLDRQVLYRLTRLSQGVDSIATTGNLAVRLPAAGTDELSNLGSALNIMVATLEQSSERLKGKNQQLDAQNEELQRQAQALREAQEQLVRAERLAAIGQLAGGVGHEIRNPLGAIKNAIYYVKGKVATSELARKEPRVRQFLDIMDDEINSANKIINDLLGYSRVGKPAVSPTKIEEVVKDALSHIPIAENIELVKRLEADLPEVNIDSDQIRQVMVNIIMNAVQAMPEGGKLTIVTRQRDEFLEVAIADTGYGIPQEAMGKIFDPLFTTKAKGVGLGLAVSKSIIDRHQGYIAVESEVGKGSTFTIKLPLKADRLNSNGGDK
ncbi:MAG: HAMP domain-containing protein [Chloroflexi bacterium]|nr:HAMP domain-containing protein [Chloroflexota bacterium]